MLDSAPIPQLITVTETEPVWHPVTDAEFKRYARIDDAVNENPSLINEIIHAATQIVESYMGTVFHRRTFVQRQTGGVEYIPAMRTPVSTVSSITYAERFESSYVTVSTSSYRVGGNDFYHKAVNDINGYKNSSVASSGVPLRKQTRVCNNLERTRI
jgi:hypothetical protein